MIARHPTLATLVALTLTSSVALGATLTGTISDSKSSPIKGIQVRLWAQSTKYKAWIISKSATTDASGKYKFTGIAKGSYKLDARMPAGSNSSYGDRWYDVTQPLSKGYIAENADVLAIKDTDNLTGYNLTLQATGKLSTTVADKGGLKAGVLIRCEQKTEYRIHHNDVSRASFKSGKVTVIKHVGMGYLSGLVPNDYRLLLHGPNGNYETKVLVGPYKVSAAKPAKVSKITMSPMGKDPNEPNNGASDKGSAINNDIFHLTQPKPYVSSGALIGPRSSGDVDWYCFDAFATDRYIVTADTPLTVGGKVREHPWVDPVVGLFSVPKKGATPVKIKVDDDGGPGLRDSKLDTGVLGKKGRYCLAVTTYGDTAFTGKTQNSAGRYRLTVKMGNRPPKFTVLHNGTTYNGKIPLVTPSVLTVKEGSKLFFSLDFSDIDKDTLTSTMSLVDANNKPVTGGAFKTDTGITIPATGATFANGKGKATFAWETGENAAKGAPYGLVFDIKDSEYTMRAKFTVKVESVNNSPSVPKLKAPAFKSTVATTTPVLSVYNSSDVDGDTLTYDFEVYYKTPGGASPNEAKKGVVQGTTATSLPTTKPMPENTWIFWRARANDGQAKSNYSAWTPYFAFLVNTLNEPPTTPVLIKPSDGETVLTRQPTLSAKNPTDSEKDPITLRFQVASDKGFTTGLKESPDVAMNTAGNVTMWTLTTPLAWGSTYYARVYAKDKLGAKSGFSYVHKFIVRTDPTKQPDGGLPDTGGPTPDQGTSTYDKGTTPTADKGTTEPPPEDENGCACDAGAGSGGGPLGLLVLLIGALVLVRRRSRR